MEKMVLFFLCLMATAVNAALPLRIEQISAFDSFDSFDGVPTQITVIGSAVMADVDQLTACIQGSENACGEGKPYVPLPGGVDLKLSNFIGVVLPSQLSFPAWGGGVVVEPEFFGVGHQGLVAHTGKGGISFTGLKTTFVKEVSPGFTGFAGVGA